MMEVLDVFRIQSLMVLPSMRTPLAVPITPSHRLAPIEMATHSIHLAPQASPPSSVWLGSQHQHNNTASASLPPPATTTTQQQGPVILDFSARFIPLSYVACLLYLSLSSVLTPGYMRTSIHVLSPSWTLLVALHAIAQNDPIARWTGALTILLLPFVLLVHNTLFVVFYTLVFAAFASGRFWLTLRGPSFVLVSLCWFCILTTGALSFSTITGDHTRAFLSAAAFFSLVVAIFTSTCTIPKNSVVRFTLA